MLLTTLRCAAARCGQEFDQEVPRWHLLLFARDAGWSISDDEELAWCPDHGPDAPGTREVWVVGCYTCDFEETFTSKEEAESEHSFHECEADTWIWSPEQTREREASREAARQGHQARRAAQAAQAEAAAEAALAQQQRIERYASQWLRIRNLFLFWKREHLQ